ncbi:nucleosome assembly factor ASF1 [Ascoidea rubescens DSM 1968]|uniref:Histone chaperone ASF1 n=1 Tax=Ascoidea rubescens DSM 1968 TaxID=1344418 RepID=A0A1D2VLZ2_9ASCO|nr:anti-silence-domain-containing protein [Ascoidea rubescens DSM 1968]ODV62622.1 anti-silence-domain-containing protein [Ascoidea rubescens DSM 1968]
MSIVSLLGINVLNNPARFTDPYEFEITFECLEPLSQDLEWKLTYVGSSRSLDHDQELDSILVGPVPVGINKFLFTADPPSPELIPASELVSVTVILLSCSYRDREFVRVGYYVNNEYDSDDLRENPPNKVQVDNVVRNILAEKPRVTRFNIVWDNEDENQEEFPPELEQPEADDLIDDEDQYGADEQEDENEDNDEEDEDNEEEAEEEDEDNEADREADDEDDEDDEDIDNEVDETDNIINPIKEIDIPKDDININININNDTTNNKKKNHIIEDEDNHITKKRKINKSSNKDEINTVSTPVDSNSITNEPLLINTDAILPNSIKDSNNDSNNNSENPIQVM